MSSAVVVQQTAGGVGRKTLQECPLSMSSPAYAKPHGRQVNICLISVHNLYPARRILQFQRVRHSRVQEDLLR
jgi:hypothetical protein